MRRLDNMRTRGGWDPSRWARWQPKFDTLVAAGSRPQAAETGDGQSEQAQKTSSAFKSSSALKSSPVTRPSPNGVQGAGTRCQQNGHRQPAPGLSASALRRRT